MGDRLLRQAEEAGEASEGEGAGPPLETAVRDILLEIANHGVDLLGD